MRGRMAFVGGTIESVKEELRQDVRALEIDWYFNSHTHLDSLTRRASAVSFRHIVCVDAS